MLMHVDVWGPSMTASSEAVWTYCTSRVGGDRLAYELAGGGAKDSPNGSAALRAVGPSGHRRCSRAPALRAAGLAAPSCPLRVPFV